MKIKSKPCFFLLILTLVTFFLQGSPGKFEKGKMLFTGQIGYIGYTGTQDPFNTFPFPLGVNFEAGLSEHIGIGGTVFYGQWSDYLRMFCGEFKFRVIRPSLEIIYHLNLNPAGIKTHPLDIFSGASLGYNFTCVRNVFGNPCNVEKIKNHLNVSAFIGIHYFIGKLAGTVKLYWTVNGEFSGLSGTVGITFASR
ncbi:MAG: hypothetical protein JSV88_03275 [Candidatus Aminicenantes bacterium]|nr:MAG: hypothetical protein JSV88_03275 [Candidatus Aminicenantes bacterium]